jgi:hypothetical protein
MPEIKKYTGADADAYIAELQAKGPTQWGLMDADEVYFFQQELEHIETEVYKTVYPQLQYRQLFDINGSTPSHKKYIINRISDRVGRVKVIARDVKDLPRIALERRQTETRVRTVACSFAYTWEDVQFARAEGEPLEADHAEAAREFIEEEFNHMAWFGNTAYNMVGFLNNTDIPKAVAPNGGGGTPQWSTKTPDEILLDINNLFTDPKVNTEGAEYPTDLMLPIAQYNYLANTRMGTNNDRSIMSWLISESAHIAGAGNIHEVRELKDAGGTNIDYAVAYTPNPRKQQFYIPMETTFFDPQLSGLEYEIPVIARSGGMKTRYPLSANIITTI